MSETETTPVADAGQANGKTDAKPKPGAGKTGHAGEPRSETKPVTVISGKPADDDGQPCDQCGDGEPGKAAAGLGLLICAVAGGLLYIGIDLVTGGGLSRKLSGQREEDDS